jgi:hypothetical protein
MWNNLNELKCKLIEIIITYNNDKQKKIVNYKLK